MVQCEGTIFLCQRSHA